MSARGPALAALAAVVAGAIVAGQAGEETPTVAPAGAAPGVQSPAVPPGDVLSSTWYCAAGTGSDGGSADHVVVIANPGDRAVRATVAVYGGEVADPAPTDSRAAEVRSEGGDAQSADSGTAGGDPSAEEPSAEEPSGEPDDDPDGGSGPDGAGGPEGPDGATVGDPWTPEDATDPATAGDAWTGDDGAAGEAARAPATRAVEVPARGRRDVRLGDIRRSPLAAALVEADGPVVVEHEVAGRRGRDVGPCASSAAPQWHLAWGATTRDARELIVLFNPFPSPVTVDVRFSTDDGVREPVRYQGFPVPAGGLVAFDVGEDVTRREQVAATVTTRSGAIVVERLQAYNGSLGPGGLALSLGVPEPLETWAFAHGRLGVGRGERIVVYNPTRRRAEVAVSVLASPAEEGGEVRRPEPFRLTVAAGRYEVLDLAEDSRVPTDAGHAIVVRSRNGVPVVAERVLTYERAEGRYKDLTAGPGAAFAATRWVQATIGGGNRPVGRLIVYNPDPSQPTLVTVTGTRRGREVTVDELRDLEVAPGGRREIRLTGDLAVDDGSVEVRSDAPVVVERHLTSAGGLGQAVGPAVPDADSAVPLARLDIR